MPSNAQYMPAKVRFDSIGISKVSTRRNLPLQAYKINTVTLDLDIESPSDSSGKMKPFILIICWATSLLSFATAIVLPMDSIVTANGKGATSLTQVSVPDRILEICSRPNHKGKCF